MIRSLLSLGLTAGVCLTAVEEIAAAPETVDYDVVFLANGQRMLGMLDELPDRDQNSITLRTKQGGVIRLRREQVASVRPSIDRRLGSLEGQDRSSLLELSRYCLIEERRSDALACLKQANTMQELDLNHLRLLARLTDELETEGPALALPMYRRCRELGASDPGTLDRLSELETAYQAWEEAKTKALAELGKLPEVKEGMEADPNWKAESDQWYNACRVTNTAHEIGPRQDKMLEIAFDAGDKYKAALSLAGQYQFGDAKIFSFWVLNSDVDGLAFSLAVKTGQTREYFESKPFRSQASGRWQEVTFDLTAKDFKSAATEWAHKTAVQNLADIREIQIQIQNQKRNGSVLLNGIGFKGGKARKL